MMKDALGREVEVGDYVVFGKSNRNNPINFGLVNEVNEDHIVILGNGNTKKSQIDSWSVNKRVFVIDRKTLLIMDGYFSYTGTELD